MLIIWILTWIQCILSRVWQHQTLDSTLKIAHGSRFQFQCHFSVIVYANSTGNRLDISGIDLVDWLLDKVHGLLDRKDAKKYATRLLSTGMIRHVVNKISFTEQCYYVLGPVCAGKCVSRMALFDHSFSQTLLVFV